MDFKYYWEDFRPGWKFENGPRALSESEIVAFAAEWDPQRYHVDAEAAKATPFGGLIASGWQTCAVAMRLMCDGYLLESACIGSPGLEELRWLRPVRPGDALRFRSTVLEAMPSLKDATRGTVSFHWELINQENTVVMSALGRQLFLRRTPVLQSAKQAPA